MVAWSYLFVCFCSVEVSVRFQCVISSLQLYDHVQSTEIVLYNSGKVDMDFCVMGVTDTKDLTPGQFSVTPLMVCMHLTPAYLSLIPYMYLFSLCTNFHYFANEPQTAKINTRENKYVYSISYHHMVCPSMCRAVYPHWRTRSWPYTTFLEHRLSSESPSW